MKKNLTKLLALMMALALVFSLAACGGGDDTGDTTTPPANVDASDNETLDAANPEDPSDTTPIDESNTAESDEQPSGDVTTPDGKEDTKPTSNGKTTDPTKKPSTDKGLNSNDKAEIVKFYKAAADKMTKTKKVQKLTLANLEGGSGFVGGVINTFKGIAQSALEKNSTESEGVPGGYSKLVASDLASASAKSDGKYTTIKMTPKEQTDPPKSEWDKGPVGHAIGVLGDIDKAINELSGVSIDYQGSGKTLTLSYKKPFVEVKIDNNTGKIVNGKWGYDVHITIDNVTAKVIGLPLTLKGASGIVNQRITMPA